MNIYADYIETKLDRSDTEARTKFVTLWDDFISKCQGLAVRTARRRRARRGATRRPASRLEFRATQNSLAGCRSTARYGERKAGSPRRKAGCGW